MAGPTFLWCYHDSRKTDNGMNIAFELFFNGLAPTINIKQFTVGQLIVFLIENCLKEHPSVY